MPAAPLPTLRRRRGGTRFVLETEMQRKRRLPRGIDWLRWAAAEKESVFGLDVWVLRYLRKATFDELAFMAQWPPSIGPRMLWAMVRANPERAITLFLRWATTGEHARFHGLGESLSVLVEAVSYTHLRAHETVLDIVCRLLLEKKNTNNTTKNSTHINSKHRTMQGVHTRQE